jgi:chemotaxis response regulator CheB
LADGYLIISCFETANDWVTPVVCIAGAEGWNIMTAPKQPISWRALIVSSHPLFGRGLQKILNTRPDTTIQVVGIMPNTDLALQFIEKDQPDLVILDCDDEHVNRQVLLKRFIEGERRLKVVLLSLKEGGSQAVVYDRRILPALEVDRWL